MAAAMATASSAMVRMGTRVRHVARAASGCARRARPSSWRRGSTTTRRRRGRRRCAAGSARPSG
eukprot:7077031-Prymnesium_polylepis.1